jgi:hypothetical protein
MAPAPVCWMLTVAPAIGAPKGSCTTPANPPDGVCPAARLAPNPASQAAMIHRDSMLCLQTQLSGIRFWIAIEAVSFQPSAVS